VALVYSFRSETKVKKAVNIDSTSISPINSIADVPLGWVELIVEIHQVTGSNWAVVGYGGKYFDSTKSSDTNHYIDIIGNTPHKTLTDELTLHALPINRYIIRGQYKKHEEPIEGESETVLEAESWDIVYPINRGDAGILRLFAPKGYLTKADYID
jgi:hypothetical protein